MRKHAMQLSHFSAAERDRLRTVFNEMDKLNLGYLTFDQLLEPLLSLGLVYTRSELKEIIDKVFPMG
jgi:Ca2+-binding EF-hand superfamily protein